MPTNLLILLSIAAYFFVLLGLSRLTSRGQGNDDFYRGGRRSPWWAVAYGMIGASISGVTFVSVPGMVEQSGMTYLQMCLGFVPGYILVAFVLLPLYYRQNLISIYTYLQQRLGSRAYRTGASYFLLSKLIGASIRLYLVCSILQTMVFGAMGVPFIATAAGALLLIWLYTRSGGIRTIVWSDCLQTTILLLAIALVGYSVCTQMGIDAGGAWNVVSDSTMSRMFNFEDASARNYFWKQFVSGIFVVIVMTGLDQDMMQKNLTCRTLQESQRNMVVNGLLYLPVNMLFLSMGVLLTLFARQNGVTATGDQLLPTLCGNGMLGTAAMMCFVLGMVAAAFSSADSAMTSLTTSVCVDILRRPDDERLRRRIHPMVMICMLLVILGVRAMGSQSVIDAVYTICGYTYGPLLGLFAFGILTRRVPRERIILPVCLAAPLLCYAADVLVAQHFAYRFGYELLLLNGMLTFTGLSIGSTAELGTDDTRGHRHV